jgi:putative nucleotidyltransferase with HDIG domain
MQQKSETHKDMVPIPINDLILGPTVPVNIYVRIGEDRFIKFANAGEPTDQERLASYKAKNVEYLWVRKQMYAELVQHTLTIAGVIVKQDSLTGSQKTRILSGAAGTVFRQFDQIGISFESYSHAKQIAEATVTLAENHKDLTDLFESLAGCSDELLKHSMAVCCISTLIAQAMKWDSRSTIEKLALGALLHDVGKKALPPELLQKPKAKMSYDEIQMYEQHPYKGMQMLLALGIVPDDVISVVYEHHENALGQGFPRRLRNLKIHPLARIVALADEFVNLTLANPNCPVAKNPREALMIIDVTMGQPHNKDCFRALHLVVNKEFAKKAS